MGVVLHIYWSRAIFFFFVAINTLNLSNDKWKLAYINLYSPKNIFQRLFETSIYIIFNMGGDIVANIHFYGDRAIFLLFCGHQDTKSE